MVRLCLRIKPARKPGLFRLECSCNSCLQKAPCLLLYRLQQMKILINKCQSCHQNILAFQSCIFPYCVLVHVYFKKCVKSCAIKIYISTAPQLLLIDYVEQYIFLLYCLIFGCSSNLTATSNLVLAVSLTRFTEFLSKNRVVINGLIICLHIITLAVCMPLIHNKCWKYKGLTVQLAECSVCTKVSPNPMKISNLTSNCDVFHSALLTVFIVRQTVNNCLLT